MMLAGLMVLGLGIVGAVAVFGPAPPPPAIQLDPVKRLATERQQLDETVWADEALAQEYEQPFITLWDDLRAAHDQGPVLAGFPFQELTIGEPASSRQSDLGIRVTEYGGPGRRLDPSSWREVLSRLARQGFRLVQSEWHHARFEPGRNGRAPRSTVGIVLHVDNPNQHTRYIVKGDLGVEWAPPASQGAAPRARLLDASKVTVLERHGEPVFRDRLTINPWTAKPDLARRQMALILYDLDGNGLSELILPTTNTVYWNRGDWRFEAAPLLAEGPAERRSQPIAGLIADFDGDCRPDFLGAGDRVWLYSGDGRGGFPSPPREIDAVRALAKPFALTAGDIDADGDLDVWLAQYLEPYVDGQMPTPFYDAQDGHPSYLLRNDGGGRFTDVTVDAGLAPKRGRRTFSTSLVDLDADGDLDLLTVNDFAGLDVYLNDGRGHFQDVSDTFVDERHAFGMSHTLADFNLDGRVDLYMVGMGSTTARRLAGLGLGRADSPAITKMRGVMGYGNRMYAASPTGLRQVPFNDQVARTGWSWGSASPDFDNDGDPDLFVANGNISNKTAKDYCTRYWTQDIYLGSSKPDPELARFFNSVIKKEMEPMSWNGFEHDCLLMNESGRGFLNIGFLMGVAFEFDSRNVAADDLDGDGRVDLVVAEKPLDDPPVLHLAQNVGEYGHHWIGVRLRDPRRGCSVLGARVIVQAGGKTQPRVVVAGDSLMTQHAPVAHFGLGSIDRVESLEVHWPDGSRMRLERPAADRYHTIENRGAGQ
jgi:hypothetical protein